MKRQKYKGFTLLEGLITLSLFCVLMGLGMGSVVGVVERQEAQNGLKQLRFDIQKARYYAKAKGVSTQLKIDANTNTYRVTDNNDNSIIDVEERALGGGLNFLEACEDYGYATAGDSGFSDQGYMAESCTTISFYVDGTPKSSGGDNIYANCRYRIGFLNGANDYIILHSNTGELSYASDL